MDGVATFLEDNGGDPRNVGEDYIEAYVPVSLLGQVSEQPGVLRVREIGPPQVGQITQRVTGHGPAEHLSTAWNQAGFSGQGVKVGIIDSGFEGFGGLMGPELPSTVVARCYTDIGVFTQNLADCEVVGQVTTPFPKCQDAVQRRAVRDAEHGTIVAESVIDIAPEVSLYIANPRSRGDLQDAVDWMAAQGVLVINQSQSWFLDGPGDGTSPNSTSPLKTVDRAAARGVIWVNSAGNAAQDTWFGGYSDPDGNGNIGFGGQNEEVLSIPERACRSIRIQLRWEDNWDGASTDLDLYLYDKRTRDFTSIYSADEQSGESGHEPFETIRFWSRIDSDDLGIVVDHHGGDAPDWIQIMVWGVGSIERYTENGSIGNPAESANPGMLAVGAAPWYDTDTIEYYSSRGPTPDGRVKPDIVGADCGETALSPLNSRNRGFCGTSQASPHVAGLAALVRQRFPAYTPAQVAAYLKDHAQQRVTPDPNNTWGHGFAQLPSPDREALVALYNATGGANWTNNTNWLTNAPIGQWHGVTTDSEGRVTELNLTSNQLKGEIPPELASLTNLKVLALGRNELTGPIPGELGSLANLQELHLTQNQLSGAMPAELGSLTNLTILALGGNQLTGPIPTSLGGLTNLEEVYLWGNELTGTIPGELGSLANLEVLSLSQNQLTGPIPTWLGSLTNLQELYLWGNLLTGEIPAELGGLANLQGLYLSDNQLSGEILAELGSLTNLQELYLWGNLLTGEIPAELGGLANLQGLYLSDNQLSGEIPAELGSLTNLERLSLSFNQLSGEMPQDLTAMTALEYFGSIGNQGLCAPVDDAFQAWLQSIPTFRGSSCAPADSIEDRAVLAELYRATDGVNWGNNANWLSDRPIREWRGVTNDVDGRVTGLYLFSNQLSGEMPAELGDLANLTVLSLWGNQLTGEIPTELGDLPNLDVLYLSQNRLTGCIPSGLQGVTNNDFSELGLPFCEVGSAPEFPAEETGERSVAENTGAGIPIGDPVQATSSGATLIYTLGGTDAADFTIVSGTGQLMTKAALDYETKASYAVTVIATDPNGESDSIDVTIPVIDVNEAPDFPASETGARSVAENTVAGEPIGALVAANDPDGDALIYRLGGPDAASFDIDSDTGQVAVRTVLDYETKEEYSVTVTAEDADGLSASIALTITVTDVDEAPATLLERYDTDDSGSIEKSEVIQAIK